MIYITVINFNGWENTIECLESLWKSSNQDFKVVVVDNKSTNDSVIQLEKYIDGLDVTSAEYACKRGITASADNDGNSTIVFLKNDINDGFAAGCNCAFRYIRRQNDYEYVWLLGSDSIVTQTSISELIEYMKSDKKLGLCGSISLSYYEREKIQCIGLGKHNLWFSTAETMFSGMKLEDFDAQVLNKYYGKPDTICVYGNSMFFSRKFFEKMRDIPEEYFLYYEEQEVMQQLKEYGFSYGIANKSIVYHKEGASTGGNCKGKSYIADYYGLRCRILFSLKYHKIYLPTVYLGMFLAIFNRIRRKQYDRVWMILKLMINPYPKLNQ